MAYDPETKYTTVRGIARMTGLPPGWLKREADAGRIPYIRVGQRTLFMPSEVRKSLQGRCVTVAQMLQGLRSTDPQVRLGAGIILSRALSAGLWQQGLSDDDIEHGAGRDLADLLGKAMAGDGAALDALEAAITSDPSRARLTPPREPGSDTPRGPVEPSAHEREMAMRHSPDELLDLLAAAETTRERVELVLALAMACGMRPTDRSRARSAEMEQLAPRLGRGEREAIEAARQWVAECLHADQPAGDE